MTAASFDTLPLKASLRATLPALGYHTMTPIQAQSLPHVLAGRDLIAQARTGSGKTVAFGLGLLQRLDPARPAVQGLVLCPTRELADQVAAEVRRLARAEGNVKVLTLTGGIPLRPQAASLAHGAHVVVGTPGRLRDHLSRGTLDLTQVRTLVLDEADRMTDMGFYDEIHGVVRACPPERQTLLFSATYPDDIREATAAFLHRPVEVRVDAQPTSDRIEERFYEVEPRGRDAAVGRLLGHVQPGSALVFCNTRAHCQALAAQLRAQGFDALALHGDLHQRERDETLEQFANRSCAVLVATDVAARGLDIAQLDAVITADMSRDPDVYIHRVGRTGRAGESGLALTLCTPDDRPFVQLLEDRRGAPVAWHDLSALRAGGARPAPMVTLCILGGRRDKLRPGDVLGALTGETGLSRTQVGRITVSGSVTYVAVDRAAAPAALGRLNGAAPAGSGALSIKGRRFRLRPITPPVA
ncbi:ATP-dependent RNA helicase DbpA (plasmid) [Deinococcus taeanensis]|uniref:ATP-dependent RNA helicase DbpA n=1 Tax=Deinococcus taeanensis TaxID=2737050 RepID=UPI001CDD2EFA|nr:ATP-dependent RNA helicase DbpA [Deinococcus taeanensis]UBV44189.1 ATP-dependent RNA helicase DbpA [Deinococcus taeanensis]